MTREEFIKVLKENDFSYRIKGDKIVVTRGDEDGDVYLNSLTTIPAGVKFENGGDVCLRSLKTLPADVNFENKGYVWLNSLTTLPAGVEFKNGGDVDLDALVGDWFDEWKGNIEGINSNRLLNLMISKGIFER